MTGRGKKRRIAIAIAGILLSCAQLLIAFFAVCVFQYEPLQKSDLKEAVISVESKEYRRGWGRKHGSKFYVFFEGIPYGFPDGGLFSGGNPAAWELDQLIEIGDTLHVLYEPGTADNYRQTYAVMRGEETLVSYEAYVAGVNESKIFGCVLVVVSEIVFLLCLVGFCYIIVKFRRARIRKKGNGAPVAASRRKQKNRKKQAQSKRQEEPNPPSGEESE